MKRLKRHGHQHADDVLDDFLIHQMEQISDLTKTDKRIVADLETCSKWLSVFVRTTKEEKYARNRLASLMYWQLKKNGRLTEPFTDLDNCNRDLNLVQCEFKQKIEQQLRRTNLASPPDLQVPQPSCASPFSQAQLMDSDGTQVINITESQQILWKPMTEKQIKLLDKMEAIYHQQNWDDELSKQTPSRTLTSCCMPDTPRVSFHIKAEKINSNQNSTQPQHSTEQHENKSINQTKREVVELYAKKNYASDSGDEDEDDQKQIVEKSVNIKKGQDLKVSQRPNRYTIERERNRAQIEKRREHEMKVRRDRERERLRLKAIEESKKQIADTRLNHERILQEKDRLERLMKVYQRREQESRHKGKIRLMGKFINQRQIERSEKEANFCEHHQKYQQCESLVTSCAENNLIQKRHRLNMNGIDKNKEKVEMYVRRKIDMATSLAKQQCKKVPRRIVQEQEQSKETKHICDITSKLVTGEGGIHPKEHQETDQIGKGDSNSKEQKAGDVEQIDRSVQEEPYQKITDIMKKQKRIKVLQQTVQIEQQTSEQEINRRGKSNIKLLWEELKVKCENRNKIKVLQSHQEATESREEWVEREEINVPINQKSAVDIAVRGKLKELQTALEIEKRKSDKLKYYVKNQQNEEKDYVKDKRENRENRKNDENIEKCTRELQKSNNNLNLGFEMVTSEERRRAINWRRKIINREARKEAELLQKKKEIRNEIDHLELGGARKELNKESQHTVKKQKPLKRKLFKSMLNEVEVQPAHEQDQEYLKQFKRSQELSDDMQLLLEAELVQRKQSQPGLEKQVNTKRVDRKLMYLRTKEQEAKDSQGSAQRNTENDTENHTKMMIEPLSKNQIRHDKSKETDEQELKKDSRNLKDECDQEESTPKQSARSELIEKRERNQMQKKRSIWTQYEHKENEEVNSVKKLDIQGDVENCLKLEVQEEKCHKADIVETMDEKIRKILIRREELKEKDRQLLNTNIIKNLSALVDDNKKGKRKEKETASSNNKISEIGSDAQLSLLVFKAERERHSRECFFLHIEKQHKRLSEAEQKFHTLEIERKQLAKEIIECNETLRWLKSARHTSETDILQMEAANVGDYQQMQACVRRLSPVPEYVNIAWHVQLSTDRCPAVSRTDMGENDSKETMDAKTERKPSAVRRVEAATKAEPELRSLCDSCDFETTTDSRRSSKTNLKQKTDNSADSIKSKLAYEFVTELDSDNKPLARTQSIFDHKTKTSPWLHDQKQERAVRNQASRKLMDTSKSSAPSSSEYSKAVPIQKKRQHRIRLLEPGPDNDFCSSTSYHGSAKLSISSENCIQPRRTTEQQLATGEQLKTSPSLQNEKGRRHKSDSQYAKHLKKKTRVKLVCSRYIQASRMHFSLYRRKRKSKRLATQQYDEGQLFKNLLHGTKTLYKCPKKVRQHLRLNNALLFRKLGEVHLQEQELCNHSEEPIFLKNLQMKMLRNANKVLQAMQDFEDWVSKGRLRKEQNRKIKAIEPLLWLPCRIFGTLFEPLMRHMSDDEIEQMRDQIGELDRQLEIHISNRLYWLLDSNVCYCHKKRRSEQLLSPSL